MILTFSTGFVVSAVQKAYPPAFIIRTLKAVDPIKLTDQPIDEAAMDQLKRSSANRAQMMRHTLTSFL
jgi:hypothetical protein